MIEPQPSLKTDQIEACVNRITELSSQDMAINSSMYSQQHRSKQRYKADTGIENTRKLGTTIVIQI